METSHWLHMSYIVFRYVISRGKILPQKKLGGMRYERKEKNYVK